MQIPKVPSPVIHIKINFENGFDIRKGCQDKTFIQPQGVQLQENFCFCFTQLLAYLSFSPSLSAFLLFRLQCNEIIDKHIFNNMEQRDNKAVGNGIQCFLKMLSNIKNALGMCDN